MLRLTPLCLLLALGHGPAHAADQALVPEPAAPTPFALRIDAAREAFRLEIAQLNARYAAAATTQERVDLQRAIGLRKLDLEIALLDLQAQELAKTDAPAQELALALKTLREWRERMAADLPLPARAAE